jgi:hypothetical protein
MLILKIINFLLIAKVIPASSSDHHPISLNTASFLLLLPRLFHFEEFWTKDPSCGSIIEAAWIKPALGSLAQCMVSKMFHTKKVELPSFWENSKLISSTP